MSLADETVSTLYEADPAGERLRRAFTSGEIPVAVHGLGKMGLPIAAVFAGVTGRVLGVDIDPDVVERVNVGDCPVTGEPGLPERVRRHVGDGALRATTDARQAADWADCHLVIVPTLVDEDGLADLSNLTAAVEAIGAGLSPGDFVIVESTVPPGTCAEHVLPTLVEASGLSPDEFGLACCPERTSSGRALRDIEGAYPRVVGGVDDRSTAIAAQLYEAITDAAVIPVADATTAECVKVFEGVYRDVNIALANELATFADELGIDVTRAIEAANTQPFCDIHTPGIGVGGHCIPYYPYFLIEGHETETPLLRTARRVNDGMPHFALSRLFERLEAVGTDPGDAAVLVLGLAYRPGVPETRESPARPIVAALRERGATVYVADPVVEDTNEFDATPVGLEEIGSLDLDAAVLVTAHEAFEAIDWHALDPMVVIDGRQALDLEGTGHTVYTIGGG